jgi:glutamine synthetase
MKANKNDYKFYLSPEIEFYYLDSEKKIVDEDDAGYFDQRSVVNRGSNFRRECVLSLEEMGIPVRSSHHEVSMNQHEIGLRHTDALTMADSIITTRLVVKQTALNHQGFATFMPRPFGNLNGNGLHLYLSLYQGDENVFYSENTKNNLSN